MNISNFMITQDFFIRTAMYKTRNTGTGNGMRGTRGLGGMLYSGECHQIFRGISPNIPGNVVKHSGECPIYFDGRELVEASSITVVFSVALLIVCSVIFCVKNLAKLLAARLNSSSMS